MFRIFTFDNGTITLDSDTLRTIPEFKVLLSAQYNKDDGDINGLLKRKALKIFSYIYLMHDLRSPYSLELDLGKRNERALGATGLGPTYKPDSKVKAAIEVYQELIIDAFPEIQALKALKEGLKIGYDLTQFSNDTMVRLLRNLKNLNFDELDPVTLQTYEATLNSIKKELKFVLGTVGDITSSIGKITEYEDKVTKDFIDKSTGKGGRTIGKRADPK